MNALLRAHRRVLSKRPLEWWPEWWLYLLSAGAWLAMGPHLLASGRPCHGTSFGGDWLSWILMVVAMMLPMMGASARWVARRSFRTRQQRAMLGYLLGYLAPWAVLGVGVAWLMSSPWSQIGWLPAAVFAAAGLWAATPKYTQLLGERHRSIPLAPTGWRADLACLRFGARQGLPCVASCGLLMVGCALTGHGALAMLAGAALAAAERWSFRPRRWVTPAGALLLAALYGAGVA